MRGVTRMCMYASQLTPPLRILNPNPYITKTKTGLIFANLLYKAQVTGYMLFNAEQKVHNLLSSLPSSPAGTTAPLPAASSSVGGTGESQSLLTDDMGLLQGSSSVGSVLVGAGTAPEEVMKLQGLIKITTSVSHHRIYSVCLRLASTVV